MSNFEERKVVIDYEWLQPGLTGGSGDTYVRHMLLRARSKGWRVVVFNSRGCGNSPVTTAQVLHIMRILLCMKLCLRVVN